MAKRPTKHDPERLGRLSMHGLDLEKALEGAMQVDPPAKDEDETNSQPKAKKPKPKPKDQD
jgi:hypothetical protein